MHTTMLRHSGSSGRSCCSASLGVAMDSRAAETPERPRRSPSVVSVGTETTIAATLETSAKASECKPVATDAKASECKTAEPDVKITGIRLAEQASRALVPFPPKKPADGEENEESSGSLSSAYMHPSISSPATPSLAVPFQGQCGLTGPLWRLRCGAKA